MGGQPVDKRVATRVSQLPQGQWPSVFGSEPGNKQQTDFKPNWVAAALQSTNDLTMTEYALIKFIEPDIRWIFYTKTCYSQNFYSYFPYDFKFKFLPLLNRWAWDDTYLCKLVNC